MILFRERLDESDLRLRAVGRQDVSGQATEECVVAGGRLPCLLQPLRGQLSIFKKLTQPRGLRLCLFPKAVTVLGVCRNSEEDRAVPIELLCYLASLLFASSLFLCCFRFVRGENTAGKILGQGRFAIVSKTFLNCSSR